MTLPQYNIGLLIIIILISCRPGPKSKNLDCLELSGCDQFKCLMTDCWCVQDGNPVLFESGLNIKNEEDIKAIINSFLLSKNQSIPELDHISDLGHGWFNVFYKNDNEYTVGPEGVVYNTTCGV